MTTRTIAREDLIDVATMATDLHDCGEPECLHIECNVRRAAVRVMSPLGRFANNLPQERK